MKTYELKNVKVKGQEGAQQNTMPPPPLVFLNRRECTERSTAATIEKRVVDRRAKDAAVDKGGSPRRAIVTVNKNFGDEAKLTNVKVKSSKSKVKVCAWSQGVAKGQGEPKELGDGPSGTLCQYSTSSVKITK
ncbi:hypothetical protein FI667_g13022, partial [Globisporangium splendens]